MFRIGLPCLGSDCHVRIGLPCQDWIAMLGLDCHVRTGLPCLGLDCHVRFGLDQIAMLGLACTSEEYRTVDYGALWCVPGCAKPPKLRAVELKAVCGPAAPKRHRTAVQHNSTNHASEGVIHLRRQEGPPDRELMCQGAAWLISPE